MRQVIIIAGKELRDGMRNRWVLATTALLAALALTLAAIILTGDIFWITVFQITHYSGPSLAFGVIPAPLILLALSGFYLYEYVRQPEGAAGGGHGPETGKAVA